MMAKKVTMKMNAKIEFRNLILFLRYTIYFEECEDFTDNDVLFLHDMCVVRVSLLIVLASIATISHFQFSFRSSFQKFIHSTLERG